jgi:hypothetical protein
MFSILTASWSSFSSTLAASPIFWARALVMEVANSR